MKIREIIFNSFDLDNVIQDMILNNIQEVLAIGRTLRNANAGSIVIFEAYNSKGNKAQ